MNIVFLDRNTIGNDIDINVFEKFGILTVYPYTSEEDVNSRIKNADIVLTNKAKLNSKTLADTKVQLICLSATGTDNVDVNYCSLNNIAVCNVKGYSTESVVQHTFASLFALMEKISKHENYTRSGEYVNDVSFKYLNWRFNEIHGKNYGIIGMGAIGQRVGDIAKAFGCNVFYWSSNNIDRCSSFTRLSLDDLLQRCDIISIHSPLTKDTFHMIGTAQFKLMKDSSIIVNMGRGDIIDEVSLVNALKSGLIGGACIDVLSKEPMSDNSPYIEILNNQNLLITPHIAWASIEARNRCISEMCTNISAYLNGDFRNRVDITL